MSAYSCCGGYEEHEKDCWAEKLKAENDYLKNILKEANKLIEAQDKMLVAYRTKKHPGTAIDRVRDARWNMNALLRKLNEKNN